MSVDRFVIGGSPAVIRALADLIRSDSESQLVEVAGPTAAPDRIVANLSSEKVELFRRTFDGHLVIETDHPLEVIREDPGAPEPGG